MNSQPERAETPIERALASRVREIRRPEQASRAGAVRYDLTAPASQEMAPAVRDAAKDALASGETGYTTPTGIEPLRRAIADRTTTEGFPASEDTTVVTNGGTEALYIALQAVVAPGDRVVLVEPVPPRLPDIVRFAGGVPELVSSVSEPGLDGAVVLVVAAPSRISGQDIAAARLQEMIEMAGRTGTLVILDRSGAPDRYEPVEPFPQPDLVTGLVTIGSFSGAFGLSGWRVGYFTAPQDRIGRFAGLKEAMSINTTTPSQFAALAALQHADTILPASREFTSRRRESVTRLLRDAGVPYVEPAVFPSLLIDVRQSSPDDVDLSRQLEAARSVRVDPASRYGESLAGFVRIDLRADEDELHDGVGALIEHLRGERI